MTEDTYNPWTDEYPFVSFIQLEKNARAEAKRNIEKLKNRDEDNLATTHILMLSPNDSPGLRLRAKLFYEDDLREAKKARDERINKNIVNGEFSTIWELDDDEELKENKMWRKASDSIRRL